MTRERRSNRDYPASIINLTGCRNRPRLSRWQAIIIYK